MPQGPPPKKRAPVEALPKSRTDMIVPRNDVASPSKPITVSTPPRANASLSTSSTDSSPSSQSTVTIAHSSLIPPPSLPQPEPTWTPLCTSSKLSEDVERYVSTLRATLPSSMVWFVQRRLRQGKLLLALVPPFGYELSLVISDEGFVGLRLTFRNLMCEMHDWAVRLDSKFGPDPNRGAYPLALSPDILFTTFLPLHPKQNSNEDAELLPPTHPSPFWTLVIPMLK